MEGFTFFFGFYGLLLGFSVAAVTRALATIVGRRQRTIRSFLQISLGVFMLLDLISLWVFAWASRDYLGVNYPSLYAALGIAIVYYFAVTIAFPDPLPDLNKATRNYWANKRIIVAAIAFASACTIAHWIYVDPEVLGGWRWWLMQSTYWVPITALLFTKSERVDLTLWVFLVIGYLGEAALELVTYKLV